MKFNEITKEDFVEKIKNYKGKLYTDCAGMFDPPLYTWNDFSITPKWPESIVFRKQGGKYYERVMEVRDEK